jgi:hypothetical protein
MKWPHASIVYCLIVTNVHVMYFRMTSHTMTISNVTKCSLLERFYNSTIIRFAVRDSLLVYRFHILVDIPSLSHWHSCEKKIERQKGEKKRMPDVQFSWSNWNTTTTNEQWRWPHEAVLIKTNSDFKEETGKFGVSPGHIAKIPFSVWVLSSYSNSIVATLSFLSTPLPSHVLCLISYSFHFLLFW